MCMTLDSFVDDRTKHDIFLSTSVKRSFDDVYYIPGVFLDQASFQLQFFDY